MKIMMLVSGLLTAVACHGQSVITPDLKAAVDGKGWKGGFAAVELAEKDGAPAVRVTKTQGEQVLWVDGLQFSEGTIEVDLKGGSKGNNFLGVAFRVVDEKTYDAVYFRPFNFGATDPEKSVHHVQYISHPKWTWSRLRQERNGQYEKRIEPPPNGDQWFHARIVIANRQVSVYVNDAKQPSLVVQELSDRQGGSVGLRCTGSGMLANLKITPKS